MKSKNGTLSARQLPLAAMLTAIVILLQVIANYIQPVPGVSISLVLVPIVIGAALLGPYIGVWLGIVFGATVLLTGGANVFLSINLPGTIALCILKGAFAGLAAALVYKALERVNEYFAIFAAGVVCPVVNTGLFLVGCRLFFWETVKSWGASVGFESAVAYMFIGLAGINFLIELGINVVLSPVILRVINIGKSKRIK